MFSIWPRRPASPIRSCFRLIKFPFLYLIPIVSAWFFVHSLWQGRSSLVKALFYVHVLVSGGGRQRCSLLYPVCQVCLLHVNELCSRMMDSQALAQLAHRLVTLLYPLPQQLRVRRIPHLALIAGRIRVHRIQILQIGRASCRERV